MDYFYHNEPTGEHVLYENLKQVRRDKYMTDMITDGAIDLLKSQPKDEPIFLYLPYNAPSAPFQHPDVKPAKPKVSHKWDSKDWQKGSRRTLKAIIERLDEGVGRVLKTLEETGRADSALVIFCSDNGAYPIAASNTPFRGHASELFEGGIQVACMARWPGKLPAAATNVTPTLTFDLTASILAAAGCEPNEQRLPDGIDILQHIVAGKQPRERDLFWRARRAERTWKAVRRRELKYAYRRDGEQLDEYLFNLADDPGETRNLIETLSDDAKQLKRSLATWEARMKANR